MVQSRYLPTSYSQRALPRPPTTISKDRSHFGGDGRKPLRRGSMPLFVGWLPGREGGPARTWPGPSRSIGSASHAHPGEEFQGRPVHPEPDRQGVADGDGEANAITGGVGALEEAPGPELLAE